MRVGLPHLQPFGRSTRLPEDDLGVDLGRDPDLKTEGVKIYSRVTTLHVSSGSPVFTDTDHDGRGTGVFALGTLLRWNR